jgi:tetratricopeptide (TPR) repeat protein
VPPRTSIRVGICFCGALVALVALRAAAQEPAPLRLPEDWLVALRYSPAEIELFDRASRGRLEDGLLLEGALVAGGVADGMDLRANLQRYDDWAARLRRQSVAPTRQNVGSLSWALEPNTLRLAPKASPLTEDAWEAARDPLVQRAAAAFRFMHREILTGPYDVRCSRLDNVFDGGAYNCVTATILFNCLARELGLTVSGGEAPAHVVSLLRTPRGTLEIETTCARWFELSADEAKRPRVAGNAASPGTTRGAALQRELGTAELTAIVYYNLGVDFAERRQFADAVAANFKALRLDPRCQNARGNLLAAVNNWALDLTERQRFAEAVALLAHGRHVAPEHETFTRNHVAIHQRWVQRLYQRGQFAQAAALLENAEQQFPHDAYFHEARMDLYRQWEASRAD